MSLVGKSVYHIHDVNKIQFGNVIDEKLDKTWKWVKVNWLNGPPTNNYNSPSLNIKTNWFRIDTVQVFNPQDMIYDLHAL
jgi:hypothetical protein|tara:strand:+ start:157 stop:396 length:240 start_codon:yes stop_codon:yes gene_type:complete